MAARIALILSQPARRDAAAIDLIENIVAAAMLSPGLDANLIGDIDSFDLGGTDYLCLQGHPRDIVLASFLDISAAQAAWQRLGLSGLFVDFTSSPERIRSSHSAALGRRVFYFQLASNQNVSALLDRCQELLAAQQLSLVSIGLAPATSTKTGTPAKMATTAATLANSEDPELSSNRSAAQPAPLKQASARVTTDRVAIDAPQIANSSGQPEESDDWSQLDKLVDDLDAMDL